MNIEKTKKFLVENTYEDGDRHYSLNNLQDILENLSRSDVTKRYFRLPDIEKLEEVTIVVAVASKPLK